MATSSSNLEIRITEALQQASEPMDALDLAKDLFGKQGRTKQINPTIYAMEKDGVVEKRPPRRGQKPTWALTDDQ